MSHDWWPIVRRNEDGLQSEGYSIHQVDSDGERTDNTTTLGLRESDIKTTQTVEGTHQYQESTSRERRERSGH